MAWLAAEEGGMSALHPLAALAKIDAHMHIWKVAGGNNPWLTESGKIAFRYGDYHSIRRDYLVKDYRRDFARHNITGSVFVETEWRKGESESEIRFVHDRNDDGFIKAVLCQGFADAPDFRAQVAMMQRYPLVRGIRQKPAVIAREHYVREKVYPGTMRHGNFIAGLSMLEKAGLIFEVQTPWWHLPELAEVRKHCPSLRIVINHAGMPERRDADTLARWQEALATAAEVAHVYIKLSGFGEYAHWSYARNRVVYDTVLALFPVERILFASNFPVDSVVVEADTLMDGFYQSLEHLPQTAQQRIFHDNALALYGLNP